jgi:hypothetical protein
VELARNNNRKTLASNMNQKAIRKNLADKLRDLAGEAVDGQI